MQAPISWLKEYIDINETPEELAAKFTLAGLEVGEIHYERFGYENSYVARVDKCEPHPDKEGFYVLTVSGGGFTNIVLTNLRPFEAGEILPIASQGYTFPDGTTLEPRKMGGIVSDGKIMAEADIEYSDDHGVVLPLPEGAKVGDLVPDAMGVTDIVLKFDLTANRSDCLCVWGICRELSAILDRPLKKSPFDFTLETIPRDVEFTVKIKDKDLCPRYTGRVIRDVKIVESPLWMKRRLICTGMRPINSLVDITNYVMLEVGQPMHAFDLDTLQDRAIVVRRAAEGEDIVTIDGSDCKLRTDMLVIADKTRPVAVAGVMGGALTEITDKTVNMLLESAHFAPRTIRRTSIALNMRSEASMRFEKGVDIDAAARCSDYAAYLIHSLGWGTVLDGMIDAHPVKQKTKIINVAYKKLRDALGDSSIDNEQMARILSNLGFKVEAGKTSLRAEVPGYRFDVSIWEDLEEEIARIYGYQNVNSELPAVKVRRAKVVPNFQFVRETKDKLAAVGLSECVSYSFTNMKDVADAKLEGLAAPVPLRNPLTEDHTHMRASLVPGMLKIVSMNMRRGNKNLSLFELGKVFISGDEPSEKLSLVIALTGELWTTPARSMQDIRLAQYYQVKGVAEDFLARMSDSKPVFAEATLPLFHPARSASIMLAGEKIGELGEVHPQICRAFDIRAGLSLAEIDVEKLREVAGRQITYKKISRFPAMSRDISIIVDEPVKAASIEDIVNAHGGEILRSVDIVDVFRGEIIGAGKKSVTFALEFRHDERTLGDEEVNAVMTPMLEDIKTKLGGMLRES